ncbi:jg6450 [Pararge aegeria aegeria]|uniref:Jg6450 protein n=1 Tax=Pararge aegeria aegeria TaxID=348720 RepID=A0A8S4RSL0_9NEOP|nr:jg6450 [Pararge aegeria aegeria]
MGLIRRLSVTQRALERAMLRVYLRDQIKNEEIRRRTRVSEAEVAMGGAHRCTLGSQGAGMAAPTGKRSVGRPPNEVDRRHQAHRREPLDASGTKLWNLELPPCKRPISNNGFLLVDMMMMMRHRFY